MVSASGRFCVGLALILSASAVSAQTFEDPGNEHLARTLEARVGEVLDRSASLAAERAFALLEAREAERLEEATHSIGGVVEQALGATPARELPDGALVAHQPSR